MVTPTSLPHGGDGLGGGFVSRRQPQLARSIEEGLPLAALGRLPPQAQIARNAAKAQLTRIKNHQPEALTPEEFEAALEHARSLAAALAGATDTPRHQLYEALGLEMTTTRQREPSTPRSHPSHLLGQNRVSEGGLAALRQHSD